jgi:two-component system, OmpR family, KDP operon response regulator KdpE
VPFTVLIAEDEPAVAQVVAFGARMTWPGCQVIVAANGSDALQQFADEQPDLVILDVAMPPPDGLEVCQRIREMSAVPILMLTARGSTLDKVRALDLGADDYVTKPFDHLELLARLRALVRRTQPTQPPAASVLTVGDVSLDTATHEVLVQGQVVRLTSTEYRLLEELMRHAGRVLPSRYLLQQVWGPEYTGEDHYLKVFVRRLRRKLGEDAAQPRYIQTEWNVGYRFVAPH